MHAKRSSTARQFGSPSKHSSVSHNNSALPPMAFCKALDGACTGSVGTTGCVRLRADDRLPAGVTFPTLRAQLPPRTRLQEGA